jgi:hypothetical protein
MALCAGPVGAEAPQILLGLEASDMESLLAGEPESIEGVAVGQEEVKASVGAVLLYLVDDLPDAGERVRASLIRRRRRTKYRSESVLPRIRPEEAGRSSKPSMVPLWAKTREPWTKGWVFSIQGSPRVAWRTWVKKRWERTWRASAKNSRSS